MLAIYTRLSVDDDDSNSIENQLQEGKDYARKNNYTEDNYIIYNEGEGVKGHLKIKERPQLSRLVEDIKQGKISLVYVRKQSRVSRKLSVIDDFLSILETHKVNIFFGDKGLLDMSLPTTKFMLQMFGAMDELAPNQQSYETKKTQRLKAERGEVWGVLPYGYKKCETTKKAIIDEIEGGIIKRIFELSLKNNGCAKIAKILNEEGIPTKSKKMVTGQYNDKEYDVYKKYYDENKKKIVKVDRSKSIWLSKTIYDMLKNRWYVGERTFADVKYEVPAIIDLKLFNDVNENLKNNTTRNGKGVEYRFLLKGILKCEKCGRPYNGNRKYNNKKHNKTSKYLGNYYQCASKRSIKHNCDNFGISITDLESFIIKHLFKNKDLLKHLQQLEVNDTSLNEHKEYLQQLEKEHKEQFKIRKNIDNTLLTKELENPSRYIKMLNNIEANIKGIETKIEKTTLRIQEIEGNRLKNITNQINNYKDDWTFQEYKEAVHNIIEEIKVLGTRSETINDNKKFSVIKIKYKGYDEYSIFTTKKPYTKWIWSHKVYKEPTQQDIADDIQMTKDIIEFETGKLIEIPISDHYLIRPEVYVKAGEIIELKREDIIDFD